MTYDEVYKAVHKLKDSKSKDFHDMSSTIVKVVVNIIIASLIQYQ